MNKAMLARRYTKALFDVAVELNQVDTVNAELQALAKAKALGEAAHLGEVLQHPAVSGDQKRALLRQVLGGRVSDLTVNFLVLLAQEGLSNPMEHVADEMQHLVDELHGVVQVRVTSALPLEDDERQRLRERLEEATGQQVRLIETVDPSLLGGLVLRIGDVRIDGSVKKRLERLQESIQGAEGVMSP